MSHWGGGGIARVGFVVGGLLLMLVAAPFFVLGGFGAGLSAAFGGGASTSTAASLCCVGLIAGVAGFILFIAGLVMKSKADLELMRAQTEYFQRQVPPPPP